MGLEYGMVGWCLTHCNTLKHIASHCNTPQHAARHCNTLTHTVTHSTTYGLEHGILGRCVTQFNILKHMATHCNTLQQTVSHWHTLQHTDTHDNTRQHTATKQGIEYGMVGVNEGIISSDIAPFGGVKESRLGREVIQCSAQQRTATHYNTLQHTSTNCNKLQHKQVQHMSCLVKALKSLDLAAR